MAHEVTTTDSGFMFNKPAWHGLFDVLKRRPKSIPEIRRKSGITWDPASVPFITLPQLQQLVKSGGKLTAKQLLAMASEYAAPNHRAIIRDDTLDVLGTWTDEGVPITNGQGFEFMEAILGETRYEGVFSIRGGRNVCLLSEFPDHITIAGDAMRQYLYTRLDHTGSGSMQTMCTDVRVQCANTDRWAIDEAKLRDGIYRVRHIGDVSVTLEQARVALGLSTDYFKLKKRFGDKLGKTKLTEAKLGKILAELYPAGSDTDRAIKSAERRWDAITAIFRGEGAVGDTRGNAPGTKWCAYNAITEYQQHVAPIRVAAKLGSDEQQRLQAERRFIRSTDDPQGNRARALELVIAA